MSLSFTETAFSEVFKLCEAENINFVEYFVLDKHLYEQIFRKVEPESFLYEWIHCTDREKNTHESSFFTILVMAK